MKKTLIAAALGAVALTATLPMGAADAGHRKHKHKWHHGHHHGHHWRHHVHVHVYPGCYWYKKKYYRTGRKYWLHLYYECKYLY